jgi:hypothetical protein
MTASNAGDPAMDPGDGRPDATGPDILDPVTIRLAQSGPSERPRTGDRLMSPMPAGRLWGWVGPLAVTAFAAILRFSRLSVPHAVNYDVYKSMDALEEARTIAPDNFWAQLKYAELHYRLRVLNRAEAETRRAAELATNRFQLALARQQMKEIRTLQHPSVRNVEWTKPLTTPTLVLSVMFLAVAIVMMWK